MSLEEQISELTKKLEEANKPKKLIERILNK